MSQNTTDEQGQDGQLRRQGGRDVEQRIRLCPDCHSVAEFFHHPDDVPDRCDCGRRWTVFVSPPCADREAREPDFWLTGSDVNRIRRGGGADVPNVNAWGCGEPGDLPAYIGAPPPAKRRENESEEPAATAETEPGA